MPTEPPAVHHRQLYRLDRVRLGRGGFAEVFRATRRTNNEVVALKRALPGVRAAARMRREIRVQRQLAHPNIMPIWDADPGFCWFTMPLAKGNLVDLREQLDEEDLASILLNVADALAIAHDKNLVHRDISPGNLLSLPAKESSHDRWVVADWGLVHRPPSETSTPLTKEGQGMGTAGFAAPEIWRDGTTATPASDVYSLGRVTAWFLTGKWPVPNEALLPDGTYQHWRGFVRACTEPEPKSRLGSMSELRERLEQVFMLKDASPAYRAGNLVNEILLGSTDRLADLVSLALDYADDPVVSLDHLARMPTLLIRKIVRDSPEHARDVASRMARHLVNSPWEDRDREYVGTPLAFIHTALTTLLEMGQTALAEDVAEDFFSAEAHWQHASQTLRTVEWFAELEEESAIIIARALVSRGATVYYRQSRSWRPASHTLATLLAIG